MKIPFYVLIIKYKGFARDDKITKAVSISPLSHARLHRTTSCSALCVTFMQSELAPSTYAFFGYSYKISAVGYNIKYKEK